MDKKLKKRIDDLKKQDKELERLPRPVEEKKTLQKMGAKLKGLIRPKKVNVRKIEDEIKEMNKGLKSPRKAKR